MSAFWKNCTKVSIECPSGYTIWHTERIESYQGIKQTCYEYLHIHPLPKHIHPVCVFQEILQLFEADAATAIGIDVVEELLLPCVSIVAICVVVVLAWAPWSGPQ